MHRITRLFVAGAHGFRRHHRVLWGGFCFFAVVAFAVGIPMHFGFAAPDVDTTALGQGPFDQLVNWIASVFNGLASIIGQLILVLIGLILIPILNYDGFATSNIVGLGWALVRDTVNMFVVVVLLVIAVLTIVGSPKVNWQQQIPRLFIYVVMVNFSRTICGFLIDIGNVIMFQFVNALVEIGAGNFAQLLKLNIAGDYSGGIDAAHSMQNLGAAYLQVALMTMILVIVGIIAIVFIYRIVVLWVLIIMSPAAFFLGGIKDIFAQAGGAYSQWWKKFSSAIVLGPILTFFLWLALAASAGGDIATKENFPTGETESFGIILQVFDMSQLTGLLLGVILLVVGLQQASSAAGALGGIAAKLVSEDMGFKIAKAGLKWPATFAGGAHKAASTVAPETTAAVTASLAKTGGKLVSYAGSGFSEVPIVSSLGGAYVGRKISEQGNKMYAAGEHIDEEQMKKARESLKHVPDKYKAELFKAMESDKGTFTGLSQWQKEAMYEDLATKTGVQKSALGAFTPPNANDDQKAEARRLQDSLMRKVIAKTEHDVKTGHTGLDDTGKTNFKATKSTFLDVTYEAFADEYGAEKGQEKFDEFVQEIDSGFTPSMVRNRALSGARGAENLATIREALNKRVTKVLNNGDKVTALHQHEKGDYGQDKADAAGSGIGVIERTNPDRVARGEEPLPVYLRPREWGVVDGRDPRDPNRPDRNNDNNDDDDNGTDPRRPRGGGGGRGRGGGTGGGTGGGAGTGGGGAGTGGTGGGGETATTGGGPTASAGPGLSTKGRAAAAGGRTRTYSSSATRAAATAPRRTTSGGGSGGSGTARTAARPKVTPVTAQEAQEAASTVTQVGARPAVTAPQKKPDAIDVEFEEVDETPKTVTPFAGADAALEERQAANNNDGFAAQEEKSANNNTGFRDVA